MLKINIQLLGGRGSATGGTSKTTSVIKSINSGKVTVANSIKTYATVKEQKPDRMVFVQVAEFYESYDSDAKRAANTLDLVLTGRDIGNDERLAMTGFPIKTADDYFKRLKKTGAKITVVNSDKTVKDI